MKRYFTVEYNHTAYKLEQKGSGKLSTYVIK